MIEFWSINAENGCLASLPVFCIGEREREIHYVHSASMAYEDGRTGVCSCLSLLQKGNETMADRLLVLVPQIEIEP